MSGFHISHFLTLLTGAVSEVQVQNQVWESGLSHHFKVQVQVAQVRIKDWVPVPGSVWSVQWEGFIDSGFEGMTCTLAF